MADTPGERNRPAMYNEATALAYTGGDRTLLLEVIGLFLANYPRQLKDLRAAVDSREGQRIQRAAHALKGALAMLGAERALALSRRLEAMGSANQLGATPETYRELTSELEALDARLSRATKRAAKPARGRRRRRGGTRS